MAKAALKVVETPDDGIVTILPINMVEIGLKIEGLSPLVMNAFPQKAKNQLMAQMSTPQSKRKARSERQPRDFHADFVNAHHYLVEDGSVGIPSNGFRACSIEACRMAGVMMTRAKQGLFIKADGWDKVDGQGLVRLESDEPPEETIMHVRNKTGRTSVVDLRARPMWRTWRAVVHVHFDADWISAEQVINLFNRGGTQVGLCEGRPGSPNSYGMGWGTFQIVGALNPEKQEPPDPKRLLNMLEGPTRYDE